jgi:cytoskeletal protein RodZ
VVAFFSMAVDRPSGGFGAKLRDARERRGVSLRQIANATKISVGALEALERNEISRLPGGIFSRAFVRSYAIEVGLDPDATIQEFIAQFPNASVTAGHAGKDHVVDHVAAESERRTAGTFLWLIGVSVPIAATLVYFATSGRRVAPPPAAAVPVASRETPPAAVPPEASTPAAPPASSAEPAGAGAAPAPTTSPTPPQAPNQLVVKLAVRRPCYVSATVDGEKRIDRLLQPGEEQTIDVRREMVVTAGDASAISLTLNGAEARPLGRSGEVVTVRVNLANYREYLQVRR